MLAIQVGASLALVVAVLWFMWRLPNRNDSLFGWGPPLALFSPWAGLFAVISSVVLWFIATPDSWLPVAFQLLYPAAIGSGVLVLWIYRRYEELTDSINAQKLQAWVGISLGLMAVAIGYFFVLTHAPT